MASSLRILLKGSEVIAPDVPIEPSDALDMLEGICSGERPDLIVGHSDTPEEGLEWLETVKEHFPKANSVELMELGPTIGSHVGPGFLSIVYLAEKRRP